MFQENYQCPGPIQFPAQNLAISNDNFEAEYAKQLECQRQREILCCRIPEDKFSQCYREESTSGSWGSTFRERGLTALRNACAKRSGGR